MSVTKEIKTVEIGDKIIMTINDVDGKICIKKSIKTPKAKYSDTKTEYYYRVASIEKAEEYILKETTNHYLAIVRKENERLEKAKARTIAKNENPYKVGDILYSSWGYDQTNVEFYQITKVSGLKVYYKEISSKLSSEEGYSSMSGTVKPIKDSFINEKEYSSMVTVSVYMGKSNYHLKCGRYNLYQTTETEKHYCSWYA